MLKPRDCGSPIVDLDGKAVGLNIARAGRTETYAIPSEEIQKLLPDLKAGKLGKASVAFKLGPRINAAGRLADADVGVRLLLAETMEEARPLADRLEAANGARQRIEAEVFAEATAQVEALGEEVPAALVVHDDRWHPGVVGIVASKLVEAFKPHPDED